MEKAAANKIILYPNPATDDFVIELGETYDKIELSISNELGQKVCTKSYYNIAKISDLSIHEEAGIYIIKIQSEMDYIATLKLIKQ